MKKDKRLIIFEVILLLIMISAMFFNKIITRQILAIILLIYTIFNKVLVKNDKIGYSNSRNFTIMLTIIGLVYVGFLYFLGIFAGFYRSTVQLTLWSIANYIIPFIIIIISSEITRKNLLLRENKISQYIIVIAMVMLDVVINTNIYNLDSVNDYFTLVTFIIISSIANNIFFNYSVKKFRNATAIIIYKIITTLYMYFIPITPDIYIFLESVFKLILPYIMYAIVQSYYGKKEEIISTKHKRRDTVILIISIIIIVLIIMLVSCKFKFGALVVGSASMTGTINKGDIIIYEKYEEEEQVKVGSVIVFNNDDTKIIHRIIDKKTIGGKIIYHTQGDANQTKDEGYRVYEDIYGQVKLRIPYIGYFTLWINDLLGGSK